MAGSADDFTKIVVGPCEKRQSDESIYADEEV
jgi:hypothetical protein